MRHWDRWRVCTCVYDLPPRPGLYAIFKAGNLFYIGQSENIRKRVLDHGIRARGRYNLWREKIPKDSFMGPICKVDVKFREVWKPGDWLRREYRLLRRLRPPGNRTLPKTLEDRLAEWAIRKRDKERGVDSRVKRKQTADRFASDLLWNVRED